jgi:hypothetical protein
MEAIHGSYISGHLSSSVGTTYVIGPEIENDVVCPGGDNVRHCFSFNMITYIVSTETTDVIMSCVIVVGTPDVGLPGKSNNPFEYLSTLFNLLFIFDILFSFSFHYSTNVGLTS